MLLSKNTYTTDKLTPAVEEETKNDRGRAPAAHYLKVAFACLSKSQKALAKVVWMEGEDHAIPKAVKVPGLCCSNISI